MIGPDLNPRSQAAYERTSRWAHAYYQAWGARTRAERESKQLSAAIPDELMNELSDSEDERLMAINRHAPTPLSMPSSPVIVSLPKPVQADSSIHASIGSKHDCYEEDASDTQFDADVDALDSLRWRMSSRQPNSHHSLRRRTSDLSDSSDSAPSTNILTRSRANAGRKLFRLSSSSPKNSKSMRHMRKSSSSSRKISRPSYSAKNAGAGLYRTNHGRVAKRRTGQRGLI